MVDLDHSGTAEPLAVPPMGVRGGLAARIVALVLLVVFGAGLSGAAVLREIRDLRAHFDLLTVVYMPFQQRLARAQTQSSRIGRQMESAGDPESAPIESGELINFRDALASRVAMIRAVRQPLDQAVTYPDRVGGAQQLGPVRRLRAEVGDLQALIELDEELEAAESLADVSRQNEISRLFAEVDTLAEETIEAQRNALFEAGERAERFTLLVSIVVSVLAFAATLAVIVTLRPLRRLTESVRKLGAGDWRQRIKVGKNPHRDDEVQRLAREFNWMAAALEEREREIIRSERLAAVGRMASQITHEIRNPLSSVALNTELLEDEIGAQNPEAHQLLGRIADEVDRLTKITESYLGFARRPEPELARTDLRRGVEDLLDFLAEEHERAGVEVERDDAAQDEALWVNADANQLRQALMNLIRNAQEAALEPDGAAGRAPRIGVKIVRKAERFEVLVSDNGPGIGLEGAELEGIFEAFVTNKPHGTGLGLSVAQQVAADHDGDLRIVETGPQGTCFGISLPSCDPPDGSVSSPNSI